jgi:hypothetical protein
MVFHKGKSGNSAGRPKGTGQAMKLREAIEADIPEIIAAMVIAAKDGDTGAAKLLLDRVIPALKPQGVAAHIDGLNSSSLSEQGKVVISAMGAGQLTPEQAQQMLAGLASLSKIIEVDDLERRLTELEKQDHDH